MYKRQGYSIDQEYGFVRGANGGGCGIYNDVDNEWMIWCAQNAQTELFCNGVKKLETTSSGVSVSGILYCNHLAANTAQIDGNLDVNGSVYCHRYLRSDTDHIDLMNKHNRHCFHNDSTDGHTYLYYTKTGSDWKARTESYGLKVENHLYTKSLECTGTRWNSGTTWGPGVQHNTGLRYWGDGAVLYYAALFEGWVKAHGVAWLSDKRIKTNISELNDVECLNIVNKINTYKYDYIDKDRDNKNTYGFIAQDVLKHLPNAVQIREGWIYTNQKDITDPQWESIDIDGIPKWKLVLNTALEFCETATKKCRFYAANNNEPNTVVDLICENDNKSFIFDQKYDNIYLYGNEITDFHHIDKTQLFALYHSAIQELDRKINRINIDTTLFLVEKNQNSQNTCTNNNILITPEKIIKKLDTIIQDNSAPNGLINYTDMQFLISQIDNKINLTQSDNNFELNYKHNLSNSFVLKNGMTGLINIDNENYNFIITGYNNNIYQLQIENENTTYINKPATIYHINDIIPSIQQTDIHIYNNYKDQYYAENINILESKIGVLESKFNTILNKLS